MLLGVRIGGEEQKVFNIGAFMFAAMTAIVLGMLISESYGEHITRITNLAEAFGRLDDEIIPMRMGSHGKFLM
jgi:hypothetical protein